jgi:hypothetical protein
VSSLHAYTGPVDSGASAVVYRFARAQLEYALRASAAQQLRVVEAQHGVRGVFGRRAASREEVICARLERLVDECRRRAEALPPAPREVMDELAVRRGDRSETDRRVSVRGA